MLIHIHTFKCCYIFIILMAIVKNFIWRDDEAMLHFVCLKYFICKSLSWYHRLITMMSNECYGTSNHQQPSCLSNSLISATSKKTSNLYNTGLLAFVRGIHCKPVYSPLKGPMIGKVFPCHDFIMCLHTAVQHGFHIMWGYKYHRAGSGKFYLVFELTKYST